MPVDLVRAGPGLEQVALGRVEQRVVGGKRIPILSREDLIVFKVLAARDKDLEDVRRLVALHHATLDAGLVRETLEALEEALGQSDLVPTFERLLAAPRK